jgi:curved DNA-binding protein CbpA
LLESFTSFDDFYAWQVTMAMQLASWRLPTRLFLRITSLPTDQSSRHMTRHVPKNPYDVLKVSSKATQAQIKSAYFVLSKEYHPDMNESADAKIAFEEVQAAYEILGNLAKRRQFDRQQHSHTQSGPVTDFEHHEVHHHHSHFKPKPFRPKRGKYKMGKTDVYNYDEFYHHHYGDTIGKHHKYASDEQSKADAKLETDAKLRRNVTGAVLAFLALCAVVGRKKMF